MIINLKKIAIMQPYLFPYLGYWQLMHKVDEFILLDDVNYINRGWINRNRILINGNIHYFTLPISKASQNKLICQHVIANNSSWNEKFCKKLFFAYGKTEHFKEIMSEIIIPLISSKEKNLSKFILENIIKLANLLELNCKILLSNQLITNNTLKGEDKIISICQKLKASDYYNLPGGKLLYDIKNFSDAGINLEFIIPNLMKYPQINTIGNNFTASLSILDPLFNCGIKKCCQLIKTNLT